MAGVILGWFFSSAASPIEKSSSVTVDWMGAYLNSAKVGYSLYALGPAEEFPMGLVGKVDPPASLHPGGSLLLYSESEISVLASGTRNAMVWRLFARLENDYSLQSFRFHLGSSDAIIETAGEIHSGRMEVLISSSGDSRMEVLPIEEEKVFISESLPKHLAGRMARGESINGDYLVYEPHQMAQSIWNIVLEGTETLQVLGNTVETTRIRLEADGFSPITWIDKRGRVLKESASLGEQTCFISYLETEEDAKNPKFLNPALATDLAGNLGSEPDLLRSTSVKAGKHIATPSQVRRMVVDLWNFEMDRPIPFSDTQKKLGEKNSETYSEKSPLRLEISSPVVPEVGSFGTTVLCRGPFDQYLASEPLVQTDHPEIVSLAGELIEGTTSPWKKALAVYQWMAENIETEFRITLPSALEVLHSKKGDCNELSTLFAALSRASGVPTRICTGLVYTQGAFYYHAWDEVLVSASPETWIPIDPALRQTQIDATHIKLGEGGFSDQAYINGLVGKIRAHIVEYEMADPSR